MCPQQLDTSLYPIHSLPTYSFKKHFNIIRPSTSMCCKLSFSSRFPQRVFTYPLPYTCQMPRPSNLLDLFIRIVYGDTYHSVPITYFSPAPCYIPLLGPNILLVTLFSKRLILRYFLLLRKLQSIKNCPIQKYHIKFFLNPLNTKRRPLYLKTQFVPRSKHFSSRL